MSARLLFRMAAIGLFAVAACSSPESPQGTAADTAAPPPGAAARAEPADAAGATAPKPYRDDIPLALPGKPRRASLLDGKADAARVDDPEADTVERGRRAVAPMPDFELADGFDSAEALAEAVLDRAMWNDFDALLGLRVTRSEFDRLFWPEFPQSRPATGIEAGDAWAFHDAACRDGVTAILSAYGGVELHFVSLRFEVGFTPYTNFDLYRGAVIQAVNDRGDPIEIRAAADFAERDGKWRVYLFDS